MKTIICGFSGIGKSTVAKNQSNVLDFESSVFSHKLNGEIDIDFPDNYVDELMKVMSDEKYDYYLVSCHKSVRDELKRRGLDYIIVLPTKSQRNEYLKRWLKRGSLMSFIKSMNRRWEYLIQSCEEDDAVKIYLNNNEYLSDILYSKDILYLRKEY